MPRWTDGAGGVPVAGSRWGATSPTQQTISTTQKIKSIGREARQNQLISERLSEWKATMRERGSWALFRMTMKTVTTAIQPHWRSFPVVLGVRQLRIAIRWPTSCPPWLACFSLGRPQTAPVAAALTLCGWSRGGATGGSGGVAGEALRPGHAHAVHDRLPGWHASSR